MRHIVLRSNHTILALTALALLGTACGFALYVLIFAGLPPVSQAANGKAIPTTVFLDRNGKLLYEAIDPQTGRQIDLSSDAFPSACVQATLATEDSRFYHHRGYDPIAIARAAWQNFRAGGTVVSGGSTLTQQLVRILLFDEEERYEQTYKRKLREAWLAWRLERSYSKDELLALYLNQSYYGHFAFGLEAAAQTFFAKPASHLSRAECALLAGLVQYPSGYNPLIEPEIAKARQLTVLRLMQEAGYLSAEEAALAAAEPLRYRTNLFEIEAPHFVMYVQDLLVRAVGVDGIRQGGLRVTTSLDLDLQREAEAALDRRLALLNCREPGLCTGVTNPHRRVENAAAVVLDAKSGDILAMVGSPDYFDESIQGNVNAALAQRQPGSAMKPFTYAVALDPAWSERLGQEALTPASILADLPTTFYIKDDHGGNVPYAPVNYDRQFHGPVSVRNALANSYNIPAVKVLDRIGVESLRRAAMLSGITSLTGEYGLALTLGGGEVSLLDLVAAYGVFQDGTRLDTFAILKIERRGESGEWETVQAQRSQAKGTPNTRVFSPEAAYLVTDILSDNSARITAFGEASVLHLPFPAAAKTGTTTDWRDNWTVGYSSQRVAGVWVGNADNAPMIDVSGIDGAGPIWRDLMLLAHTTKPPAFDRPSGISTVEVCTPSGMLPSAACPQRRMERFAAGTEPETVDDQFSLIAYDVRSGTPATDATPLAYRADRIVWDLPPEYREWSLARGIQPVTYPAATDDSSRPAERVRSDDSQKSTSGARLALTSPASNTAYQVHPALPQAHQRIRLHGRSEDGQPWAELRLVLDGEVVATQYGSAEIEAWWPVKVGEHRVWLEGMRGVDSEVVRTDPSWLQVTAFDAESAKVVAVAPQD